MSNKKHSLGKSVDILRQQLLDNVDTLWARQDYSANQHDKLSLKVDSLAAGITKLAHQSRVHASCLNLQRLLIVALGGLLWFEIDNISNLRAEFNEYKKEHDSQDKEDETDG